MKKPVFETEDLLSLLKKRVIVTLDEMKQALGTSSTMTVFRKLKQLGYRTSYSHRGKYYTLAEIPIFDEQELWSYDDVWFSRKGSLLDTSCYFVEHAQIGFTANELATVLHVEVKQPLLQLQRQGRIDREKIGGVYVYLSSNNGRKRSQHLLREEREMALEIGSSLPPQVLSDELKAAIILFFSLLDEKQRRLYAGLESHKLGHGGDSKISELLGVDVHTVSHGRRELFSGQVQWEGIRKRGGGRKRVEKKHRRLSKQSLN
jgi:hypothetical protein